MYFIKIPGNYPKAAGLYLTKDAGFEEAKKYNQVTDLFVGTRKECLSRLEKIAVNVADQCELVQYRPRIKQVTVGMKTKAASAARARWIKYHATKLNEIAAELNCHTKWRASIKTIVDALLERNLQHD